MTGLEIAAAKLSTFCRFALNEEGKPTEPFIRLMQDFALWTRQQSGVPHYHTPLSDVNTAAPCYNEVRPRTTLTDDEGSIIDAAICKAKLKDEFGFYVFWSQFLKGLELDDLAKSKLCAKAFRTYKRAEARKYGNKLRLYKKIFLVSITNDFLARIARNLAF